VYLCDRPTPDYTTSASTITSPPSTLQHPIYMYPSTNLSPSLSKIHAYAAKFIDLIRSKTPKIIFYSPQAKCQLMENFPDPDFEMAFYNGVKVHHSCKFGRISFRVPVKGSGGGGGEEECQVHEFDISGSKNVDIPTELAGVFRHVQECLRQCLDIDKSTEACQGNSYPLILKSSNTGNGGDGGGGGYTQVSSKGVSPVPSVHHAPTSVSNFSAVGSSSGRNGDGIGGSGGGAGQGERLFFNVVEGVD
ncbi:UNVERIFIED_CONTAM: Serine/threonine-protein kinase plk4, partial [Siphonaria sp. JEL0065]